MRFSSDSDGTVSHIRTIPGEVLRSIAMSGCFLAVRLWPGFTATFPFDRFDECSDEELGPAIQDLATDWATENAEEIEDVLHDWYELQHDPTVVSIPSSPSKIRLEVDEHLPGGARVDDVLDVSIPTILELAGLFNASSYDPRVQGGEDSTPSRRIYFCEIEGNGPDPEQVADVLRERYQSEPAKPRFEVIPKDGLDAGQVLEIEARIAARWDAFPKWSARLRRFEEDVRELLDTGGTVQSHRGPAAGAVPEPPKTRKEARDWLTTERTLRTCLGVEGREWLPRVKKLRPTPIWRTETRLSYYRFEPLLWAFEQAAGETLLGDGEELPEELRKRIKPPDFVPDWAPKIPPDATE